MVNICNDFDGFDDARGVIYAEYLQLQLRVFHRLATWLTYNSNNITIRIIRNSHTHRLPHRQ